MELHAFHSYLFIQIASPKAVMGQALFRFRELSDEQDEALASMSLYSHVGEPETDKLE